MPKREEIQRIDERWQALQPGWGRKDYEGERKMLYDILQPAEDIELLHSCGFETKNVDWAGRHDRGVVVATGHRVILLNRGRVSKNRFSMTYQEIDDITETGTGMVRLWGTEPIGATDSEAGAIFDLDLQLATKEFSRFVRGRLLSDGESVAAAFPSVLEPGEQVRHWAHCSAGQETIHYSPATHYAGGGRSPESWSIWWDGGPAIAVATEGRILLVKLSVHTDILLRKRSREEVVANCPHGTIQTVEHTEKEVRFVDLIGQVYTARFHREADASPFVDIMQEHAAAARQASAIPGQAVLTQHDLVESGESPGKRFVARLQSLSETTSPKRQESAGVPHSSQTVSSKEARFLQQWVERSPVWDLGTRKKEREKLLNILQDDEDIERLVEGQYEADKKGSKSHDVVIAATDRRLLFVYNGFFGEHVNEMPYSDIGSVEFKKGFLTARITIAGRPGVDSYIINYVEKDVVEEFVSCVQSHL